MKAVASIFALSLLATPALADMAPPVTLADAQKALAAARTVNDEVLTVAVVDKDGHLISFAHPPCAQTSGIFEAIQRAIASAFFGQSSAALERRARKGDQTLASVAAAAAAPGWQPNFSTGAEPIKRADNGGHLDTVGAVGCGGGTAQENAACAKAGVAALGSRVAASK